MTRAMLASEDGQMQLSIRKILGDITIEISVTGEAYDFAESLQFGISLDMENIGQEAEITICNIILRSFADDLKYRNRHGRNAVRLTVLKPIRRSCIIRWARCCWRL